jgi:hypothetical protein
VWPSVAALTGSLKSIPAASVQPVCSSPKIPPGGMGGVTPTGAIGMKAGGVMKFR